MNECTPPPLIRNLRSQRENLVSWTESMQIVAGKPGGKTPLGDLVIDENIIIKLILQLCHVKM
jgi:hypothetical protein